MSKIIFSQPRLVPRRLKILQLQPDYNVKADDFADLAEQIVKALPIDQYEVVSAFLRGHPKADQPASRAEKSVYFNLGASDLGGLRLRALWKLYRFCRAERFDAVICNRFKPVNMMLFLNRLLKIPVCVGLSHGLGEYDRAYRRFQARLLVTNHWKFVSVSDAVKNYLLNKKCGFTESNTVTINNAIDISQAEGLQLSCEEARSRLELPLDACIIGAVGRAVQVKGHIYLIRAFAKVKVTFPGARLVIIGGGKEEPRLRAAVTELGLTDSVLLTGSLPNALQYIRAFDLLVMPSLSEGLPLALLEGMSAQRPIIGSDIPSMHAIIKNSGGELVAPADERSLALAIEACLSLPPDALQEKGRRSYEYLCSHHDIYAYHQQYRQLLEAALAEAGVVTV